MRVTLVLLAVLVAVASAASPLHKLKPEGLKAAEPRFAELPWKSLGEVAKSAQGMFKSLVNKADQAVKALDMKVQAAVKAPAGNQDKSTDKASAQKIVDIREADPSTPGPMKQLLATLKQNLNTDVSTKPAQGNSAPAQKSEQGAGPSPQGQGQPQPGSQGALSPTPAPSNPPQSLLETSTGLTEYHVIIRAFIPGAGTRAAAGAAVNSFFKIAKGNQFDSDYAASATESWGGWTLGWWELDEIFDTNSRDWSYDGGVTTNSKAYVHVKLVKNGGAWRHSIVKKGSSTTHHRCDGPLRKGVCCSVTAQWTEPNNQIVKNFNAQGDTVTFKVAVRKGNPCVPGSYHGGPIMWDMDVNFNAATGQISVTGKKSKFPAYEVLHGRTAAGPMCGWQFGVRGENVYSLMESMANISPALTMNTAKC